MSSDSLNSVEVYAMILFNFERYVRFTPRTVVINGQISCSVQKKSLYQAEKLDILTWGLTGTDSLLESA